ncbi:flagellar protein [Paenibacillus qinlingensis]|uniref:Ribosomal protein L32 n=1 Tax=Paenibacillus qinlingensis TaxID=1837343 RepID=A0ABU1NR83_9BACL|nr:flagellar protein [Paenibacillus qinlingensis]MDR6549397.1 ribosomal protein L32 [Paenibacillus qinlingensis]
MSIPQQLMVANCPRCGKVFQRNLRNQCMDCSTSMNDQLKHCVDYLRRNYRSSNEQVCAVTGVSSIQLQMWMKEGKLPLSDYPNLSYPCASCAEPIREHKLCVSCSTRITRDIRKLTDNGTVQQRMKQPELKPQGITGGFKISDRWNRV